MVIGMDADFGELSGSRSAAVSESGGVGKQRAQQRDREWLKVSETLPSQLLNVYGRSAYADMDNLAVWRELCKPLKTGARYMSELASPEIERQGVGMNRWMPVAVGYLQYQNRECAAAEQGSPQGHSV